MVHAKKSAVIEVSTKACRWLLIVLLPCDFAFTVALMTRPQNTAGTTFEESEDLNYAVLRLATSSITAILSVISLLIALPRYKLLITRRMIVLFSLRIVSVMLIVPELAFPTPLRTALTVIVLFLIFVELVVVSIVFVKISKVNKEFYGRKTRGNSVGSLLKDVRKDPAHFVEVLDDWLLLKDSRKMLRRKYHVAQTGWALANTAVLLIGFVIFVTEFAKIASTQSALYSPSTIDEMNSPQRISYYNSTRDPSKHHKVLVVVMDGLRYDHLHINTEMYNFLTSPQVAPHSKIYKMSAQLPSMSVPNWVTILTGAPPEATGVLGNLLVPETRFDSMFRQARNFNLNRGLTGSPWFSAIIDSTLPFLGGDGTIPTSLGADGKETSDIADDERANVYKNAIAQVEYPLFLVHLSDIDIQGHCCGVTKEYNRANSYYNAVTNKTALLSELLNWVANDTVVIMVADHGHVDCGGHGGIDRKLREVPLVIYQKDSYLANKTFTGPRFSPEAKNFDTSEDNGEFYFSNFDVSPTVCALLGVPVPRQNQGKFIDDAMVLLDPSVLQSAYYDLYKQKQSLVQAYIKTEQVSNPPAIPDLGANLTLSEYVDAVNNLMNSRSSMRSTTDEHQTARNVVVTAIICVAVGLCILFLMQHVTYCDPWSIVSRAASSIRRKNRIACFWAFTTVFVYYGLSILIYYIGFVIAGYKEWDSTVIHYPGVLTRYAAITLVPAVIIIYVSVRLFHIYYTVLPPISWQTLTLSANPILLGRNPILKDTGVVFLYRYYLIYWTVVSWLIFLILQSTYTFIIPPEFQIRYIGDASWVLRFRVITVQLMSLPLCFCAMILLFFGFPSRNANKALFDPVYVLKITKDLLHAGHPAALENLQEELSSDNKFLNEHKNFIFYTSILDEVHYNRFKRVHNIYDVTGVSNSDMKTSTELRDMSDIVVQGTLSGSGASLKESSLYVDNNKENPMYRE